MERDGKESGKEEGEAGDKKGDGQSCVDGELSAIRDGLHRAQEKGIRQVLVFSDSLLAVQAAMATQEDLSYRDLLIQDIMKLLANLGANEIRHVRRIANNVAHKLVNFAILLCSNNNFGSNTITMYGRDPWGGPLEIAADSATDDDRSRNLQDYDKAALSRPLDETQQSWLLGPGEQKKKKYVDLGCIIVSRKIFVWTVGTILAAGLLAAGRLPKHNNVSWRGNSCLNDGKSDSSSLFKDLTGGYYDAGDAIKFNFPQSFAMTMLSWSVIEYSAKYEAAGELNHVKDTIKWGTDYFLKTFNSTADTIDRLVAQDLQSPHDRLDKGIPQEGRLRTITTVGCAQRTLITIDLLLNAIVARILQQRWLLLWRPHRLFSRTTKPTHKSLSMVLRRSLNFLGISVADTVLVMRHRFSIIPRVTGMSSCGAQLGCIMLTGNTSYLQLATTPGIAKHAGAFGRPFYGVLNWDNKLAGAQMNYILGKNPRKMSYVVGFGNRYPKHVHHRGASIPKNKVKYNCKGGWKWRDSSKPNPNTIVGAMVAGPDRHDGFHDVRSNYNYTEPTLAGNAGLVAALVALSGDTSVGIDKNTMFSAVPPMFPTPPPPPAPWKP
ncbi:hypothetical protein DH2020_044989 [Rehmannia glutinosa]|uniref:Endoglucanase n=1 Tax=Rehmannia glutinosa TaxID=99300 RepID=A0ABR0UH19_REHGL